MPVERVPRGLSIGFVQAHGLAAKDDAAARRADDGVLELVLSEAGETLLPGEAEVTFRGAEAILVGLGHAEFTEHDLLTLVDVVSAQALRFWPALLRSEGKNQIRPDARNQSQRGLRLVAVFEFLVQSQPP